MDRKAPLAADPKDPGTGAAYAWTLLGTALPIGVGLAWLGSPTQDIAPPLYLMAAGTVAGPSLGQLYAGSPIQAALALASRGTGLGLILWSISREYSHNSCIHLQKLGDDNRECKDPATGTQLLLGNTLFFGGILYSLIDTHWSVDRARARNAARRNARLSVDPWLAYGGPDNAVIGGRAQLRF